MAIYMMVDQFWHLAPREQAAAVDDAVPDDVSQAVALALLSQTSRIECRVKGVPLWYTWSTTDWIGDERKMRPRLYLEESWEMRRRFLKHEEYGELVGLAVHIMRCLPAFRGHPVLRFVPGRKYHLRREVLPATVRCLLDYDHTHQRVLCEYHTDEKVSFRICPSRTCFFVSYSELRVWAPYGQSQGESKTRLDSVAASEL